MSLKKFWHQTPRTGDTCVDVCAQHHCSYQWFQFVVTGTLRNKQNANAIDSLPLDPEDSLVTSRSKLPLRIILPQPQETVRKDYFIVNTRTTDSDAQFTPMYTKAIDETSI